MTSEVIAVAKNEQTAGFTKRFSRLRSVKDAFKFWAEESGNSWTSRGPGSNKVNVKQKKKRETNGSLATASGHL